MIIVSLITIFFGIAIISNPEVFHHYENYKILGWFFNATTTGIVFVLLGVMNLVSIYLMFRPIMVISLSILNAWWFFAGVSFFMSRVPSTLHIFSFGISAILFGVLLKEVLE